MSRVLVKILLAPIILPMIIVMSLLSLMITIVASVYENVAGLPMKLVGICILLALFTKSWLAAVLFGIILAMGYLVPLSEKLIYNLCMREVPSCKASRFD
ncbi:hypothetical protein [Butyrivibrio sp. LC3010]|uniref:hypothetical protein n=1 Tax=Butyrivibrio sp. LC3010 TaxID=1280680 RepID=UPI00047D38C9|nr:hypothetical protein [Butyrivibrio sp. LC3010]